MQQRLFDIRFVAQSGCLRVVCVDYQNKSEEIDRANSPSDFFRLRRVYGRIPFHCEIIFFSADFGED